jgi:hypothetical protein
LRPTALLCLRVTSVQRSGEAMFGFWPAHGELACSGVPYLRKAERP